MGKAWTILAPRDFELGPLAGAAREGGAFRHWRLARDENAVTWLVLDKAGASANTLSEEVLAELDGVLAELERSTSPFGVSRSSSASTPSSSSARRRKGWCCAPPSPRASSPGPTSANFAA